MTVDNFKKLFDSMPVWKQCHIWNRYIKNVLKLEHSDYLIYPWDSTDVELKHLTFDNIMDDYELDAYEMYTIRLTEDLHDHYCFYLKGYHEIRTFDNLYEFFEEDALEPFFELMAAKAEKGE